MKATEANLLKFLRKSPQLLFQFTVERQRP